jgi:hypothetical protein
MESVEAKCTKTAVCKWQFNFDEIGRASPSPDQTAEMQLQKHPREMQEVNAMAL